ncbi:MAG: hypothetical protein NDI73_09235 [Desulfuromonadales bacterium]|nr:hypothetical protein [Desulfuromonadales bacterium]
MKRKLLLFLLMILVGAVVAGIALFRRAPANSIQVTSTLIMLGDLNNDSQWTEADRTLLTRVIATPYSFDTLTRYKIDVNKNGRVDDEDLRILDLLCDNTDPYLAESKAREKDLPFPRPRELFAYLPSFDYVQPPVFLLDSQDLHQLPLSFANSLLTLQSSSHYEQQLLVELYDELSRLANIYAVRRDHLSPAEQNYLTVKLAQCEELYRQREFFELLLVTISLVEDGETLYYTRQEPFIQNLLFFRDDLRALLQSREMASFSRGETDYRTIYHQIEKALNNRLELEVDIASLGPPRDFTKLENYLDRLEWQKQKSAITEEQFKQLIRYAQHDRRYLRAVSRTNPRHKDLILENHNLPMVLLFREALHIMGGDKKAAVALLDEAIRIPLGWVKSIPKEYLPKSLALENFLLPGNKEDGADKSRHWNVFGGVSIYKSPKEALILSLQREAQDLKDDHFTAEAMREFIRDTIANVNGIYHVHSITHPIPGA